MAEQTTEQLAAGLQTAMRAEHQGYHFYSMAKETIADEKGREIFAQLAEEEKEHLAFLSQQFKSIVETGMPDGALTLGTPLNLSGDSPIFSNRIRSRIDTAHAEMTALSVGIQLELDAVKAYSELADKAGDAAVAAFYRELAEWERGHYNALLTQETSLKEDYWSGNGFAPF
jgi:rubrerythrin